MKYSAKLIIRIITVLSALMFFSEVMAGSRFTSLHPCFAQEKKCLETGVRNIDGFEIHRDCWEWSYSKTCNYPSKNNCSKYAHCYLVALGNCLLHDSLGNCVNKEEEYSCKRWVPAPIESQKVRTSFKEKDGLDGLICEGVPCIDGNCVDKSFMTNGEMMDSISKLYAVSQMKAGDGVNIKLFEGYASHCSKKATGYSNCCSVSQNGWGKNVGAGCSKDEQLLINKRKQNLCVYVGKEDRQRVGVTTVVKHHYCCFGQMLDKVIQVEGRKQLGLNFGSGGSPNCRGLTLDEIQRIDFDRIDFTDFIEDFKAKFFGKYKSPNSNDMSLRIKSGMSNIRQYDGNLNNQANNRTGWSDKIKDELEEAEQEKQIKLAAQQEELARKEALRKQEEQRIADNKRKQEEEAKALKKKAKEQQLALARDRYNKVEKICYQQWNDMCNNLLRIYGEAYYNQHVKHHFFLNKFTSKPISTNDLKYMCQGLKTMSEFRVFEATIIRAEKLSEEVRKIEQQLITGNY